MCRPTNLASLTEVGKFEREHVYQVSEHSRKESASESRLQGKAAYIRAAAN